MTKNEEIFIKVLEYGAERGLEGTDVQGFNTWASEQGFLDLKNKELHQLQKCNALHRLLQECFQVADNRGEALERIYVLKNEYYFRLIKYRELQEARNAAKEANRNAFFAIGLSILTLLFSGFLTYTHLINPVSINKADMQALIESNKNPNTQTVRLNQNQLDELKEINLEPLQMAQILSAIESGHAKSTIYKPTVNNPSNDSSMIEAINQYYEQD
jgi:hypothetical protein